MQLSCGKIMFLFVDTPICRFLFHAVITGFPSLCFGVSVEATELLAKSLSYLIIYL